MSGSSLPARRQSGSTWRALRTGAKNQFPHPGWIEGVGPGHAERFRGTLDQQRDAEAMNVHRHRPLHLSMAGHPP